VHIAHSTHTNWTKPDSPTLTHDTTMPTQVRFISPDPTVPDITKTQSFNRYMFVSGNPISFVDMDGYQQTTSGTSTYAEDMSDDRPSIPDPPKEVGGDDYGDYDAPETPDPGQTQPTTPQDTTSTDQTNTQPGESTDSDQTQPTGTPAETESVKETKMRYGFPDGWYDDKNPRKGKVYPTSPYGWRTHPKTGKKKFHNGVDIGTHGKKLPVSAVASGKVIFVGNKRDGYGRKVVIDHGKTTTGKKITTISAHLSKTSVKVGDTVNKGDQIGNTGDSGTATGVHLHYEVRINDKPINPKNIIWGE
jgi:murein DD-endopeptidase MepM/ murein hydrolase activator NlpD